MKQAAGRKAIEQLKLLEEWRASSSPDGITLSNTGGVSVFFDKIVGFTPRSGGVRNMFERPGADSQCEKIYAENANLLIRANEQLSKHIGAPGNQTEWVMEEAHYGGIKMMSH